MARLTYEEGSGQGFATDDLLAIPMSHTNPDGTRFVLPTRDFTTETIALSGGTTSAASSVPEDATVASVGFPSWSGTPDVTLQGSHDGTNWFDIYGFGGADDTAYTWSSSAGGFMVAMIPVIALHSLRVKTSTSQTATVSFGYK